MGLFADLINEFNRYVLLYGVRDSTAGSVPDGSRAPLQVDENGNLKSASVVTESALPDGAATESTQQSVLARIIDVIAALPRLLATGGIAATPPDLGWDGAALNSDPRFTVSTSGSVTYIGTAAILAPVMGTPATWVANLPTTYTAAEALTAEMTVTLVTPGGDYDFYVGVCTGYSGDPLASSVVALRFRTGGLVSIYQKADLGDTTDTLRAFWNKSTLPGKTDGFQQSCLLHIRIDRKGIHFFIGAVLVHQFYTAGDVTVSGLPNLAVGAAVLRVFAHATTSATTTSLLATANPRLQRLGTSDRVSLSIRGRSLTGIPAGATRPILALRCTSLRNGFANGARYYPISYKLNTNARRVEIIVYLGTAAQLYTALPGVNFEDVAAEAAVGWLQVDRSATDITLAAGADAYRVAGPDIIESLTTQVIEIKLAPQKALAIRGDGEPLILLFAVRNTESGFSADANMTAAEVEQLL